MDKKNTIYMVIIVGAFAATAYLLYSGFSGKKTEEPSAPAQSETQALPSGGTVNILPLGNKFDTSILKQLSTQFNVFNYPQVTPDAVGISASELIKTQNEAAPK